MISEERLKELFKEAINERGIYKKIGWSMSKLSNYKSRTEADIGVMLEVLYKLGRIKVYESTSEKKG